MDLQQLSNTVLQLEASKDFFLSTLAMQTGIFSSIILVAGLFIYLQYRNKIKSEVKKQVNIAASVIDKKYEVKFAEEIKKINEGAEKTIKDHDKKIILLQANVCRSMAAIFYSRSDFMLAFIWQIRTAQYFSLADSISEAAESLIKSHLKSASQSLKNLHEGTIPGKLSHKLLDEYQENLSQISDKYSVEKDNVEKEFNDCVDAGKLIITL